MPVCVCGHVVGKAGYGVSFLVWAADQIKVYLWWWWWWWVGMA